MPEEVPLDCVVYRAVKVRDIKEDGTPKSGSFADLADDDGSHDYMSVYFADQMAAAGKSLEDLQSKWGEDYAIFAFTAAELVSSGEHLWRDPNDEFPGHGACKRVGNSKRTLAQKRGLARQARPAKDLE